MWLRVLLRRTQIDLVQWPMYTHMCIMCIFSTEYMDEFIYDLDFNDTFLSSFLIWIVGGLRFLLMPWM